MKKTIFILVIILVVGGVWFVNRQKETPQDDNLTFYRNSNVGVSFSYPKILNLNATLEEIELHHDIPYENHGDCDMMGDENTYPRLTDFKVTIRKTGKGLVDTMKINSPYIPQENFINDTVVPSPGFIDPFKIGDHEGYAIYEGAEGCGQTTYYIPRGSNETLVINRASIQVLSGVVSKEKEEEVLVIPGVISREKYEEMFILILNSLKFL